MSWYQRPFKPGQYWHHVVDDPTAFSISPLFEDPLYGVFPWWADDGIFIVPERLVVPGTLTSADLLRNYGAIPLAIRAQYVPVELSRWCLLVNVALGMVPAGNTPWFTFWRVPPTLKMG